MGCGTSKADVIITEKQVSQPDEKQILEGEKASKLTVELPNDKNNASEPTGDHHGKEEVSNSQNSPIIEEVLTSPLPLSPETNYLDQLPLVASESVHELAELLNTLADITVSDVLHSSQTSFAASESKRDSNSRTSEPNHASTGSPATSKTNQEHIPVPSSAPVGEDHHSNVVATTSESNHASTGSPATPRKKQERILLSIGEEPYSNASATTFQSLLHKACKVTDNSNLVSLSSTSHILKLERTFYCFTKDDFLSKSVASMTNLNVLDLRGGQCGPIAFKIIVNALIEDHQIKDLNLSDNLANPECSEIFRKLLLRNSTLESLNVSGNQLGKDALSRYFGAGLQDNSTLKSLNISGCGATDLHCLCETLRNSPSTTLTCLDASHNCMTDGHQFGIDLSLILEGKNCKLEKLDLTNTGITPSGLSAVTASLIPNTSLEILAIGQNSAKNVSNIGELVLNGCIHSNLKALNLSKTRFEETASPAEIALPADKVVANPSRLAKLEIADCGLTNPLVHILMTKLDGKLVKLQELDISNNNDLSIEAIALFDKMSDGNLMNLKAGLLEQSNALLSCLLPSTFTKLRSIDMTRSRLSAIDIKDMCTECHQDLEKLTLNGIKLSGTGVIPAIVDAKFITSLSHLHLSGCQLNDGDMQLFNSVIRNKAKRIPLHRLDLSVNRLTSEFLKNFTESLVVQDSHPLDYIDLSNNLIDGLGLDSLTHLFTSTSTVSNLKSANFSCNDITASSMITFFEAFKTRTFPLEYLNLGNQSEMISDEDAESLGGHLKDVFFGTGSQYNIGHVIINFAGIGGSDVQSLCSLDSMAIKTDFVLLRKPSLAIRDVLDISKGINILNSSLASGTPYQVSSSVWKNILAKDAPAWAFVTSQLKQAAYFTHMPGTVTMQRLQGMLEMEADCEVKDIFLIKDPIMRKPTGAAWVLFEDSASLAMAIEWYFSGSAQMYGTPFIISEIPIVITDESSEAGSVAQRDIAARELEQKKKLQEDQQVLEESLLLAAERAEYREAHPAYQGGRIS